jgi:hypothetical protein
MRSPIQPQKKAPGTAPSPDDTNRRLAEGQMLRADDEGENIANQKKVEEIQHVARLAAAIIFTGSR